jgi:predicted RNA binding protein YcfA (HicA-like mRNA interferase family)
LPKLPRVSGKRVARALQRAGFVRVRCKDDHAIYLLPATRRSAVVPIADPIVKVGTLGTILRSAELTAEEFVALLR